jgi:biotin transport system substrate-specific component
MQNSRIFSPTLIDVLLPERSRFHNVALVVSFSLLIALSAQIALPLPFTPVPLTMQTFAVLLAGILLGSRLGAATLLTYLAQGLMGLPVFAPGGPMGVARLLGPTGGYLVGFLVAAFVVGLLAERGWDRGWGKILLMMVVGNLVIYAFGVTWLSQFLPAQAAIASGLVPFLIGDAIKIGMAMVVLPLGWSYLKRR